MRLSLGPLQYFWSRDDVLAFYRKAARWQVDTIYLGETVCNKRRELTRKDWISLALELTGHGHEVILSSLALIEADSDLSSVARLVENGRFLVEANDMSAVDMLSQRRLPFVGGPTLNIYNHATLQLLMEDGLRRLVLGVEQGRAALEALCTAGTVLPELEVIAWGRLPLAFSARCFTARALDLPKDACGFRCIGYPDGLPMRTRDGKPFLTINGIQLQTPGYCDLSCEIAELRAAGVNFLRLYPQAEGMEEVIAHFRVALESDAVSPRIGDKNRYWDGSDG